MTVGVDAYDDCNEESEDDKCNAEEKEELQEVYSGIRSMTWVLMRRLTSSTTALLNSMVLALEKTP